MSLICPQCGAENRPQAKFCLKCAKQLVALAPSADEQARAARRRKRRRRKEAEARAVEVASESALAMSGGPERVAIRWVAPAALVVAGLAALSIAAILWTRPAAEQAELAKAPPPPAASVAPPTMPAPALAARDAAVATPAPAGSQPDAQAAVLIAGAAASAALSASADTTPVAHKPARPPAAATTAATPPARAASRPGRKTPERVQPATETVQLSVPSTPVAPPSPAAPAAPGTLCGDRAFIARAVCLQSECSKPALRQHPNCVRMREQQEVLRQGSGGG